MFMRSDGGLTPMAAFSGSRAILSGPAGGVVGYAMTTYRRTEGQQQPIIGFDMGGTSTDVSRYAGEYEHVFEATTAGISIQAPQLDINTVAAGGGSRLFFRSGLFVVGPESAGAHPGPACYRKGGPLTVTDANLCLGRLLPAYFPRIFGPNKDLPLSPDDALQGFRELTNSVNTFLGDGSTLSIEEVAMGFIRVANEAMCRPIRALTQLQPWAWLGRLVRCPQERYPLPSVGHSGFAKAQTTRWYSGILSAYGLALADVVHEAQEPCALPYGPGAFAQLDQRIATLEQECMEALEAQGFARSQISTEPFLHLRYERTDCALMCSAKGHPATPKSCCRGDFGAAFAARYQQEFGFTIPNRAILVDDVRVRATASSGLGQEEPVPASEGPPRLETVFWPGEARPVFFVASRGHHADIGGITPGSMPPHSRFLQEEGAVFVSFKLVKGGVFQEEAVTEALMAPGRIPGSSGTRNLQDNLSDLRAQVAANQKGIHLVNELIGQYGLEVVQAYMAHIQGCLAPIRVIIPKGSILDPSLDAAVVGGNVLTSQRVVDVIFRAFEACAASQGCMNNVTFGNEHVGYYETVAGGSGAGPHWHGRSGVHTHMTNTRITDPEILEKRYPVVLKCFQLAHGTGGDGQFHGGSGVRRELQFREEMVLSVLSERRAFRPYGLQGGKEGAPGLNLLIRRDGRTINLGGKTSVTVYPGTAPKLCLRSIRAAFFPNTPSRAAASAMPEEKGAQPSDPCPSQLQLPLLLAREGAQFS
ncbi:hypothetical protein JD844_015349 [Phrynosoma platyrhinos]|uniref:5-oxoprolinase n=1 Tax=Phrynosoma platyrhinos TaxID=52577 RepID=A0ABQ7SJA2_PHRPL|nr:hypothetical protein JD844_015349 [Phrynosoma platyrhinos]